MKIMKSALMFLQEGACWAFIASGFAFLALLTYWCFTVLCEMLQPVLQAFWDTGWMQFYLVCVVIVFIVGGVFGWFRHVNDTKERGAK